MTDAVSVVIVNYNAGDLLRQCVAALRESPATAEIIVVDNASSDGSLAALIPDATLTIVKNTTNTGFAAACNTGLQLTTSPYLLFLNPDCLIQPGALEQLVNVLNRDTAIGMVGGLLINSDGTEQGGGRRAVPTPWRSFVRAFGLSALSERWPKLFFDFHLHKEPLPTQPIEVEAISGACMLVKREAMDDVGVWDEGYFLHCEDLDWCMRFRQQGWKILFVPDARITHALGVCGRSRPLFVEWHKHKGMCRFYCKFFRHQYPGVLMYLVIVAVWLRFGFIAAYHLTKRLKQFLSGSTHG